MTKSRKSYHHGDLRQCLLSEGLKLIKKKGVKGLSLRAVARAAGVSAGAPYHHFENRTSLMAGIAQDGFSLLLKYVVEAKGNAEEGMELVAMGNAYASFATQNPDHFRIMFHPDLAEPGEYPGVQEAGDAVFEELVFTVMNAQDKGTFPSGDINRYILLAWSVAHGISTLLVNGPLQKFDNIEFAPDEMGRIVVETLNAVMVAAQKAESAGLADLSAELED